ncbi:hypothetical protein [Rhizobium sp. BK176]|uniref:hypothetical protein n=1 Tax=Rhizobium sp. BK176 TaxID=2587071 RepID=UPI0021692C82|nr:hypothetical protein [Rhizobium sp. BK176]MCS4089415.1 hypothetical protein [Rhizobium sp. BK176]
MELHFETIMKAAEQQLANEAHMLVNTDHRTAVKLATIAVDKIAHRYSTAQKLTILAGVRDIDELEVEIAALAPVRKMSEVATVMLKSCIAERLGMVTAAIDIAVFGNGVLRAAESFLKVAEAQHWVSKDEVVSMRDAYERLYAGEGSEDDLRTLLKGAAIFNKLFGAERPRERGNQLAPELSEMRQVANELKFYRDLLRPGWPLLASAYEQLNDQQRRDRGLTTERKAPSGPK